MYKHIISHKKFALFFHKDWFWRWVIQMKRSTNLSKLGVRKGWILRICKYYFHFYGELNKHANNTSYTL